MANTVAVTGATGFVGQAVCRRLQAAGWRVVALTQRSGAAVPEGVEVCAIGDLAAVADFAPVLAGMDAVVHLAAKVHVMAPTPEDAAAFHAVNVEATRRLAAGAAAAGVKRLLFLSSIKVNGETTAPGRPFRAEDAPHPQDDYGRSKAEAEAALREVAARTPLEVTVIRPPVVYGPGVKANIAALARLCDTPLPLPFGATRNARSMIAVDNLADAVAVALAAPAAAGKTYLVRDGEDLSTAELIRRMRRVQGRPARLVPVPPELMEWGLKLSGRGTLVPRLLGSLTVDDGPLRRDLGWTPPLTVAEGLRRMGQGTEGASRRLLFLVTEDWYFWSHRVALARAARDAGWQVHVACRVAEHGDRIRAEGFTLHPLRKLRRSGRNPWAELAAIAEIRGIYKAVKPDLVHHIALKPVLYGSLAARLAGVPSVINAMAGMGSVFSARRVVTRLLRPFIVAAFRFLLGRANQWLVVQNDDDAALFRDRGLVRPGHIKLIPGSGVDTEAFTPRPEPAAPPVVATVVARMLWDKGIGETVEAARLLKQRGVPVVLRLVGGRDPENPNAIPPDMLEAWRREGVVELHGVRGDIAEVWAESHIAVLASYREGMPRSLLEAAACGRPLVTTDVPGCRALVEDGANGLVVPPHDADALAAAIARLAAEPELRRRLGAEARRRVETTFGDGPVLRAFLEFYEEVRQAGGPSPAPAGQPSSQPASRR